MSLQVKLTSIFILHNYLILVLRIIKYFIQIRNNRIDFEILEKSKVLINGKKRKTVIQNELIAEEIKDMFSRKL